MTSYLIESLKDYKKKNKLTDREIARSLEVCSNSVYNWRNYRVEPSALAKSKIREYLIKNL